MRGSVDDQDEQPRPRASAAVAMPTAMTPPTIPFEGEFAPPAPMPGVEGFGLPAEPPPEVLAEIAAGALTHARLRAGGRELCFSGGSGGGPPRIVLFDRARASARALSAGEAFALACPQDAGA
jgi:hypothetical protein